MIMPWRPCCRAVRNGLLEQGWGRNEDMERIEEHGRMRGARPDAVSAHAKKRQKREMGTLGSGNHYLEVQHVTDIYDVDVANRFGIHGGDVVLSIHCGSRGLGHQIGTEFLKQMVISAKDHGINLPDRELACAPLNSPLGQEYLGAMRAGINCALANRQIITDLARAAFAEILPQADLTLLYDVSHNTCKEEEHAIDGQHRRPVRSPQRCNPRFRSRPSGYTQVTARCGPAGIDRRFHGHRLIHPHR